MVEVGTFFVSSLISFSSVCASNAKIFPPAVIKTTPLVTAGVDGIGVVI